LLFTLNPLVNAVSVRTAFKKGAIMAAIDPVCTMKVGEGHAAATVEYAGELYFFCSLQCQQEFEEDPAYYVRLQQQEEAHLHLDSQVEED
jgi:YHS domain-containing protein